MIATGMIVVGLVAIFLATALIERHLLGLSWRQALLYTPLKLFYRIDDSGLDTARNSGGVVYVISHQSRLDPALMLSLLPTDTLHILDPESANSALLEPYRTLGRTVEFNPAHIFISRRLVRRLKGNGRLAIYLPENVEPDTKSFRLYRAVARIAMKADANVVPVMVDGSRFLPQSLTPAARAPRTYLPALKIRSLEPLSLTEMMHRSGPGSTRPSNALFDRMALLRLRSDGLSSNLFAAIRAAADRYGRNRIILEDTITGSMTYKRLFIGARVLAKRFHSVSREGEAVGLLLPNSNGVVAAFLALQSAGRVAAMINYSAGPANVVSALRTAQVRTVVSSRAFVEKAQLEDVITAIEKAGANIIWLEELRGSVSGREKLSAALFWRKPLVAGEASSPAVILFTSGSEGTPKGVVLSHRNLISNAAQAEARIAISVEDMLFNVLPVFHSFGLTGGTILPILFGVKLFLYPSPLHYKIIPQVAAKIRPTIMFGTDTFLAGYARMAKAESFSSLRFVVAGAEAVRAETRKVWKERFDTDILEGFGLTEAAPVVAVNSATHGRHTTVGRLLPGMQARLVPVEGIEEGGRLWVSGPNVMLGYMMSDRPGELQPIAGGWHDTGDIVSIDDEGFITIRGRAKRFAKIAGEMVSLGAVEMLVQSLWPEDRHAAVSVPDHRKGERIVLVTTAGKVERSELQKHGKTEGYPELMVPGDIIKVGDIPVLGSGKTDYVTARQIAVKRLGIGGGGALL